MLMLTEHDNDFWGKTLFSVDPRRAHSAAVQRHGISLNLTAWLKRLPDACDGQISVLFTVNRHRPVLQDPASARLPRFQGLWRGKQSERRCPLQSVKLTIFCEAAWRKTGPVARLSSLQPSSQAVICFTTASVERP